MESEELKRYVILNNNELFDLLTLAETEPGCKAMNELARTVREKVYAFRKEYNSLVANLPKNELMTESFIRFYRAYSSLFREEYVSESEAEKHAFDADIDGRS